MLEDLQLIPKKKKKISCLPLHSQKQQYEAQQRLQATLKELDDRSMHQFVHRVCESYNGTLDGMEMSGSSVAVSDADLAEKYVAAIEDYLTRIGEQELEDSPVLIIRVNLSSLVHKVRLEAEDGPEKEVPALIALLREIADKLEAREKACAEDKPDADYGIEDLFKDSAWPLQGRVDIVKDEGTDTVARARYTLEYFSRG